MPAAHVLDHLRSRFSSSRRDNSRLQKQTLAQSKGLLVEKNCPVGAVDTDRRLVVRCPVVVHHLAQLGELALAPLIVLGWHEAEEASHDVSPKMGEAE
jgi:hypothetical protein